MSVYFAQVGPYIKVGFSRNPERRVRRLFCSATEGPPGTPHDLASRRLIRHIDGSKTTERLIHDALADFRVQTEWFLDEPEVHDFIEHVEPATSYAHVERPAGPYERPGPTAEQQTAVVAALDRAFARAGIGSPSP